MKITFSFLFPALLLLIAPTGSANDFTWNGPNGGLWSVAANWTPNGPPQGVDNVIFAAGNINDSVIDTGFNVSNAVAKMTVQAGYTGTISFNSSFLLIVGPLGISVAGGTFDASGGMLDITSTQISGGTFRLGSVAINNLGAIQVSNTGTLNCQASPIVCTSFSQTGGTFIAPNSTTMQVKGNWSHTGGTFTHNSGTVSLFESAPYTIDTGGAAFFNLSTDSAANGMLINSNLTVNGTFNMNAASTTPGNFDANGKSVTVVGAATITAGVFSCGTGTINFNGGITVQGSAILLPFPPTPVNGTLTCGAGTVNVADFTLLGNPGGPGGVGVVNLGTGAFNVSGNWSRPYPGGAGTGSTFKANNGTVTFTKSSGVQTLEDYNTVGNRFFNIVHSGAGTLQMNNSVLDVLGSFTQTAGTFDANTKQIQIVKQTTLIEPPGGTCVFNATNWNTYFLGGLSMTGGRVTGTAPGTINCNGITATDGPSGPPVVEGILSFATNTIPIVIDGATSKLIVSGTLQDGGIDKSGAGTLVLSNTTPNALTGPVNVNAGNVQVDGDNHFCSYVVNSAGTLSGTGAIGPLTVNAGGIVDPAGASTGTLTVQGAMVFNAGATLNAKINGTGSFDKLTVAGTVNIAAGTLVLTTATLSVPIGTTFTLIDNDAADSTAGSFAGLPESSVIGIGGRSFQVSYAGGSGNDVTVKLVNTPPTATVKLNNTAPSTNDTLTATATKADGDGDAVTLAFAWKVNGVTKKSTQTVSGLSDTFDLSAAGNGGRGDIVTVEVTPSDPGSSGTTASDAATIRNAPPEISSTPFAAPNPAGVMHPVIFSASANDADGDAGTYMWTFGDGSTGLGASVSHAYVVPGTYQVTLIVGDGTATLPILSLQVVVTTLPALIGDGTDSDGDGFSDTFETQVGSTPQSFTATPMNNLPVSAAEMQLLAISKTSIKLNFVKQNSDLISLTGTIPIPAGFVVTNQRLHLDIGGVVKSFTLSEKGISKAGGDSFKLQVKSKKGAVAAQASKFSMVLSRGTFSGALVNEGLTGDADVKNAARTVMFSLVSNGIAQQKPQALSYSARKGKSGKAK